MRLETCRERERWAFVMTCLRSPPPPRSSRPCAQFLPSRGPYPFVSRPLPRRTLHRPIRQVSVTTVTGRPPYAPSQSLSLRKKSSAKVVLATIGGTAGGTHYHRTPGYPPPAPAHHRICPSPARCAPRRRKALTARVQAILFPNADGYADFSGNLRYYIQIHASQSHTCDINAMRMYVIARPVIAQCSTCVFLKSHNILRRACISKQLSATACHFLPFSTNRPMKYTCSISDFNYIPYA